jgi:hypothetical protein
MCQDGYFRDEPYVELYRRPKEARSVPTIYALSIPPLFRPLFLQFVALLVKGEIDERSKTPDIEQAGIGYAGKQRSPILWGFYRMEQNNVMKRIIFAIFIALVFCLGASAQSGLGSIRGFVVGGIHNDSSLAGVNVELRAIENHSHTESVSKYVTDGDGFYEIEVSFGYYLLTISAEGYVTYQTKVFIPSSRRLEWGTMLEKSSKRPEKPKPVARPWKSRREKSPDRVNPNFIHVYPCLFLSIFTNDPDLSSSSVIVVRSSASCSVIAPQLIARRK